MKKLYILSLFTVLASPIVAADSVFQDSQSAPLLVAQFNPLSTIENNVETSMTQNLLGNVLGNSQITSQLSPGDQSFRSQQFGNMLQSGNVNQPQQWVNPQTGSSIGLNPVGQPVTQPQTQQQCQTLQETVTTASGQTMTENRQACQDPQSGQWILMQ